MDLPQPFGSEDGDVFAGADAEVHVVQHHAISARDVHVAQFQELRAGYFFDTRFDSCSPAPLCRPHCPVLPARLNGSTP